MTGQVSEQEWVLECFRRFTEAKTPVAKEEILYSHPVLLSKQALEILAASGSDRRILALLDETRLQLWDHPEAYRAEFGPLHEIFEGLRVRRLSYAEASARAVSPERAGLLSSTYMKVVLVPLEAEAWKGGAYPTQAAEVALDSAWAMPFENLSIHVRLTAARGFILVVHAALTRNPDGRLLKRAHEAGVWAVDTAQRFGNPSARADLLHELGTMELAAYTSRWAASSEYPDEIGAWLARAAHPMPEPAVALERAIRLLTEAADLRDAGSNRGETLKALLQAEIFAAAATGSAPDRVELSELAAEALAELDPGPDGEAIAWVQVAIDVYGLERAASA